MQWEYLRLDHYTTAGTGPSYVATPADEDTEAVLARDATQLVGIGVDRDYGQLNDLGQLGWELVAMSPGASIRDDILWRYVFKRPLTPA
jgi:hypothetical protein